VLTSLLLAATLTAGTITPAGAATEMANVGTCLLQKCQLPLARCVADPTCAANLLCIQTCAGKPDESTCQITCGDKFTNDVVGDFTKCAVSDKKCVPQRQDDGSYPVPKTEALVENFEPKKWTGPWYISAGYNPAFDTFDCQLHNFESPADNKLVGKLQWRIKDPVAGTNFVTRYTVQEFIQDPKVPAIMYNHDNEFLHYEDDWYILAAREEAYWVVYYRGNNDAWDGYGGAVIYSRDPDLPKQYYKEIDEALQKVGLKFKDFTLNDNKCKPRESRVDELVNDLGFVESRVAGGLAAAETSVVKEAVKDLNILEQEFVKDVKAVEQELEKDVKAVEKELEKDVVAVEKEVERDVESFFGKLRPR